MAAKKKVDPIKQREKRAKIAAIGGVVLLLAVAAWEGPKMMKLMNQKPVVPPPSAAAPAGTSALPGTDGVIAATGETPSGELADTDVPPVALDGGQLVSFDVFQTKDPFRPQVTNADLAGTSDSGSTAAQPAGGSETTTNPSGETPTLTTVPTTTTPATAVPSTPAAPSAPETTTTAKPTAPTVSISVNGVKSRVSTGGTFPSSKPVFRLVSWAENTARIGIVGGSYSTGDPTLELTVNKAVTLQNTSDGQRFKLILLSTP
jgi:hypothetical protein